MSEENYWTKAMGRRFSRRQALKTGAMAGLGLAAMGGLTAGCSTQENKPAASGGTPTSGTGAKRGGILRQAFAADPPHWDVHTAESFLTIGPAEYVYSGLLKLDEKRGDDLITQFIITPDLAESYEQPSPTEFVFKLRKGVKFHNKPPVNGREMTSEDVKFSVDRIRQPEAQYVRRSMFEDLDKIETPDKYTVKFVLKRPSVPFLYNIASPWTLIAPKEVVDKDGDLKKAMIGTGPFTLDDYTRNVGMKFKRNPDYFLKDQPYLDGIDIKIIPDTSTSLAALRAKDLDIGGIAFSELENFKKSNPDAEIVKYPGTGKFTCVMRLDRPPVNDVRVRKALQLAIDYKEFIDIVSLGQGRRDGPLQWWLKPYALAESDLPQTNIDKAKQLLAEAGYPNGFEIEATVSTTLNGVQLAEVAQSQWKKIGVTLKLKTLEWGAWLNTVWGKKDFTLYFLQDWNHEDPDRWLYPYFHSKGSQNYVGYADPAMDAMLDKQRGTFNVDERVKIMRDIQLKLLDDVAYIPLYTWIGFFVRQPHVKDWGPSASWPSQHSFGAMRAWLNK